MTTIVTEDKEVMTPEQEAELAYKKGQDSYSKAFNPLESRALGGKDTCLREAFGYYTVAAEKVKTLPKYQFALAKCYENGFGIDKNEKTAFKMYMNAAERGHGEAQYNVARCYKDGIGTGKSVRNAAKYYEKAKRSGFENSQTFTQNLEDKGKDKCLMM